MPEIYEEPPAAQAPDASSSSSSSTLSGKPVRQQNKKASLYESLPLLDQSLMDTVRDRSFYESKVRIQSDPTKVGTGVYKEDGKEFLIVPKGLFNNEDNVIGSMITDFTKRYNLTVLMNDAKLTLKNEVDEKWLIGFWFGFDSSNVQKRRMAKKEGDLGMTCAHCLCVSHFFNDHPQLGARALDKDNFFFGNDPMEKTDKGVRIGFYAKAKFISQFNEAPEAQRLWSVMNHFARLASLNNMNEEDLRATITYHLRRFEGVCAGFTREVYSLKKGKQVVSGHQKANLPKKSPLLLPGEATLVESLISYKWESLARLQKDWSGFVLSQGFDSIIKSLSEIYSSRWLILQKFAKMTTKRLQRIRELVPEKKASKKANITRDDVLALLRDRRNPLDIFYTEISDIIPQTDLLRSVEGLKRGGVATDKDAIQLIKFTAAAVYTAVPELSGAVAGINDVKTITRDWDEVNRGVTATYSLIELSSKARSHMVSNPMNIAWNKVIGKLGYLISTYKAIIDLDDRIHSLDKKVLRALPNILELPIETETTLKTIRVDLSAYISNFFKIIEDRQIIDNNAPSEVLASMEGMLEDWNKTG